MIKHFSHFCLSSKSGFNPFQPYSCLLYFHPTLFNLIPVTFKVFIWIFKFLEVRFPFWQLVFILLQNISLLMYKSKMIFAGSWRLSDTWGNIRQILIVQVMLWAFMAYSGLWCSKWNWPHWWPRLALTSASGLWCSWSWIDNSSYLVIFMMGMLNCLNFTCLLDFTGM